MKQILLRLDGSGKIPEELLREIRDSHEEVELIFDAEEYDELFPVMQKLFDEISLNRIKSAKKEQEKIKTKIQDQKMVAIPILSKKAKPHIKGQERRQLTRWPIGRQAKIRIGQSKDFNPCLIEDMNLKGMRLSMSQALSSQENVKLLIVLSDNIDLELEAQVPWRKSEQGIISYGLRFNKIKDADKDRIYGFINSHCAEQMKDRWWA